ncbi:MAG: GntR family transcriptional regulator [Pseudomonadota bacterium]|nr:GntR family transcriptional regulator [Pseudomonadota bacterium]MEE3102072.1 GntR family transcriptional regulator [Pseudomonadota bacterium]
MSERRLAAPDDVIRAFHWTRRPRTLPEQIADDASRRILAGEFQPGERVGEVELADRFGVSRGPVREAIRELEKRGLVEIFPRRGAFVAPIDNDMVADTFNVRAALLGLAARYAAALGEPEDFVKIEERVKRLEALADDVGADPLTCALASARVGAAVGRASRSALLKSMLVAFAEGTLWGLIWREHQVDFLTQARRREAASGWRGALDLIRARDGAAAEAAVRDLLHDNRDRTLASFSIPGAPPADPRRQVRIGG